MKNFIVLESKGVTCGLYAKEETIEKILADPFTYHFIPDLKIEKKHHCDVYLTEVDKLNKKAVIKYPHAKFKEGLGERDIVSFSEYLLERARQEKNGHYSLSSATATCGGKAVTFFGGATNLGKTSSMLELISKNRFKFYSDEKTLLDLKNKKIVGGSRSIATRKGVLKQRTNNLNEFHILEADIEDQEAYLFIYPHIDRGTSNPIVYQFSTLDFHWLLSRELGGVIRGVVKFIDDFTYPLPSLDTRRLSNERVKRAIEFTREVPCFYFQGSLEQNASFIENFFKENGK